MNYIHFGIFLFIALISKIKTKEEIKFLSDDTLLDYDMYVMSIQWGPTLCLESEICKRKIDSIEKNIFTLHGLWPNNSNGKKMMKCNEEK